MPCNYNPATNEVETLLERYQRESEIDARIELSVRVEQAMRAVNEVLKQHNRTGMTKAQKISELILKELAATGSIKQAFDRVIGEGAYDKLAHDIYTELRAK